jgi:hypothetical protein
MDGPRPPIPSALSPSNWSCTTLPTCEPFGKVGMSEASSVSHVCTTRVAVITSLLDRRISSGSQSASRTKILAEDFHTRKKFVLVCRSVPTYSESLSPGNRSCRGRSCSVEKQKSFSGWSVGLGEENPCWQPLLQEPPCWPADSPGDFRDDWESLTRFMIAGRQPEAAQERSLCLFLAQALLRTRGCAFSMRWKKRSTAIPTTPG